MVKVPLPARLVIAPLSAAGGARAKVEGSAVRGGVRSWHQAARHPRTLGHAQRCVGTLSALKMSLGRSRRCTVSELPPSMRRVVL